MPSIALAGVRDRGEVRARVLVAVMRHGLEGGLGAVPGVGQEGERFGRRPGFRGDDHQRVERVEVVERGPDIGRIGRVEDPQGEVALERAERPVEDVRGEAAAAHPGHDRGGVALVADRVPEGLERRRSGR